MTGWQRIICQDSYDNITLFPSIQFHFISFLSYLLWWESDLSFVAKNSVFQMTALNFQLSMLFIHIFKWEALIIFRFNKYSTDPTSFIILSELSSENWKKYCNWTEKMGWVTHFQFIGAHTGTANPNKNKRNFDSFFAASNIDWFDR